ncbi:MAG: mechanosensitive ion channel family protein [Bacteroidia bacterium]
MHILKLLVFFVFIFPYAFFLPLHAQTDTTEAIYSLETPQATVSRHLYYLQPETFNGSLAAETVFGDDISDEDRLNVAVKIKDIFDARGDFVQLELIPNNPDFVDSVSGKQRYIIFPDKYPGIYVEKYGNRWLYSQSTVNSIQVIYDQVFVIETEVLKDLTPTVAKKQFLGLQVWQYEGMLIILVVCLVIYLLFNWILGMVVRKVVPRFFDKSTIDTNTIPPLVKPMSWLLLVLLISHYFMPLLLLPISFGKTLSTLLKIAAPVFGVLVFYRLVEVIASVFKNLAGRTSSTMDDQLVPLLTKSGKLVVVVFGIIFVLQNLGVNVNALLAGVSIGGLALALAAQDTVRNFIGSISIFVDRPFMIGEFIETSDFSGSVVEVGVRSTRLLAVDGALISIPNGKLADLVVTNHGVRTYRRYVTNISITYGTSPETIEKFVAGIREIVLAHPDTQKDNFVINFHEMADSSLNIYFSVFFNVTEFAKWLAARQDIFLSIMHLAKDMGVSFAFPSTSVYIESMPEKK